MIVLLNIIFSFLILSTCPAFAISTALAPQSGKTLLLVGQDRDTIAQYVDATGNVPAGTMLYTSIQETKGLQAPNEYGAGPQDGQALLQSYPNSVLQVGLYMVNALDDTLAGTYDANLTILAQWLKSTHRPVYLRIGYEFDNPENHYDPELYKETFRYIVDFLRNKGVDNVAFVWHSWCPQDSTEQWMDWYPGDNYVDWFGASIFSTAQIPMATNFLKLAREHDKPFMIAESTPCGMYTLRGKKDWFTHIFQFIEKNNVEAFCYINSDWDELPMFKSQHWGDARLEDSPELKDLWLQEINQDRYLKSSPDLFESLG